MAKKNQMTTCNALEWEDALRLIDYLKANEEYRFALLAGFGFYSGLRISDILNLKWGQILNIKVLDIREKKTKKIRRIYLNEKLQDLIALANEKLMQGSSTPIESEQFVFLNRFGSNHISIQYVNRMFPVFLNRIGIECSTAGSHTMRKTFGKRLFLLGDQTEKALIMLGELLHHSSVSSTRQYIGISQQHYQEAYLGL